MRLLNPRHGAGSLGALVLLALGLLVRVVHAADPKPELHHTLFDSLPAKLMYFDDTSTVLYHDQMGRNVWRSDDEGKTWGPIGDVPRGDAYMLIEHPHDNRVAYILTAGTTHWRTTNRGDTWRSFTTQLPPSLGANVLAFHANKADWIIYTGQNCRDSGSQWGGKICHEESFVTKDAFASSPQFMLTHTSRCIFAHDKKEYAKNVPDELVYCVAFEAPSESAAASTPASTGATHTAAALRESRLYSSTDFFAKDKSFVDLGVDHREARGVVGIGGVAKYLVVALKPPSSTDGEMMMYVTQDGALWSRARFPHGHGLRENAYTIVESTQHSLLVDINSSPSGKTGTLFRSNSDGEFFVHSLANTNRNAKGLVDFERIVGLEGVAVANTVANAQAAENGEEKMVKTRITFDDGAHWSLIKPPSKDHKGKSVKCDGSLESCSLHLHSVTQPHNYGRVFSSTAPGLIMGVGSIGDHLLPYDECDTFLSTDGGLSWRMVEDGAMKYEFGDQGSVLVMVDDEDPTSELVYSFDFGQTWATFDLGVKIRARLLTTIPDSTSLKFIVLGTLTRHSSHRGENGERHVIVHIDFDSLKKRNCGSGDFEKWYARSLGGQPDCLMGHKQWFQRRKPNADCWVHEKFKDPVGQEENCPCEDEDYECDFNFAPDETGSSCVPIGSEKIPAGQCLKEGQKFKGSSGYRLIPGNTCNQAKGIKKDTPIEKPCHAGQETPGVVTHQVHQFAGTVVDQAYFGDSHTVIVFTSQNEVWQSQNEGFTWERVSGDESIMTVTMHAYDSSRAYLITKSGKVMHTTDKGRTWNKLTAPAEPNTLAIPLLDFHPLYPDMLIWAGQKDCAEPDSKSCRAVAYYTLNNGRKWYQIDEYVRVCTWARDTRLKIDDKMIFCESYANKRGSQRAVYAENNPLQLVAGKALYESKKVLFHNIVGFATFEEYMVVAELFEQTRAIGLKISLDGEHFALARFPPNMHLENQAYTVLESSTDSIFLHVTTHSNAGSEWGTLFKSNSNGTYYAPSLEFVNRNSKGYVDFEKMVGLEGVAVMNVVSNPDEAALSGHKKLQTRITHNDGGRWKALEPPRRDSLGRNYECNSVNCNLHVHGYTERRDVRATYSSPTAVGMMMAVGNVGESLLPYTDSDTFLTRDGGFTWEEVHKDAHMWEYGDQGAILVLVNDEEPTDHVTYTLDEGLTWSDYSFGEKLRVSSIQTVPTDTSRKFILFGSSPGKSDATVAVHLDFSSTLNRKCKLDTANPKNDDFELWTPAEEREETCLFGKQTLYHRRIRDAKCFIGEHLPQPYRVEKICPCTADDFECEFNYRRDSRGQCVLVDGAQPLETSAEDQCAWDQPFWYDRTSMRRIPKTKCEGGLTLDQGTRHTCPGHTDHSWLFWGTVTILPFGIAALAAVWWTRRRSWTGGKGRIRLPEAGEGGASASGPLALVASIPFFLVGLAQNLGTWISSIEVPYISDAIRRRQRSGYRAIRIDDDAELLRDYDEDDE